MVRKNLILVLILVLAIILVIWFFFLKKPSLPVFFEASEFIVPKINLETLSDPRIENLKSFPELPSLLVEIGRENPFLPY